MSINERTKIVAVSLCLTCAFDDQRSSLGEITNSEEDKGIEGEDQALSKHCSSLTDQETLVCHHSIEMFV
jgi:hypothetical protein